MTMVGRLVPVAIALVGACIGPFACNAINGVADLEARDCAECEGGRPNDVPNDGGGKDALADGRALPDAAEGGLPAEGAGSLDATFGTSGIVLSALIDDPRCVAVRADGKIYVGGASANALAVARFNEDGTPDTTFGSGGRVTVPNMTSSVAQALSIDAMGRVVAAGYTTNLDVMTGTTSKFAYVVRIGETAVDNTFATNGRKTFTVDGEMITSVVVISANGDFAAAGSSPGTPQVAAVWTLSAAGPFLLPRADLSYIGGDSASATAMTAGAGAVTIAGNTAGAGGDHFGVARYTATGLDNSFDGDGKLVTSVGPGADLATAIVRLPDGSVVVGGATQVGAGAGQRTPQFGLVRLQPNGALATTFGTGGKLTFSFAPQGATFDLSSDRLQGMVADAKGRVVAVGYAEEKSTGPFKRRVVMARITPDGKLDPLFAAGGKGTFQFNPAATDSRALAVAAQPDGKLIIVGESGGGVGIARVNP